MERKKASDYPQELLDLFHEYQHGGIDRRTFLERTGKFAVGGLTAATILSEMKPNYALAQQVPKDDARIKAEVVTVQSPLGNGSIKGLFARPARMSGTLPAIIVIHENRGLNAHIEDVARRLALAGFATVAPDLLTPLGGTPADEDKARDLIGKLDLSAAVASAIRLGDGLKRLKHSNRKLGIVGFCWGGAFVDRYAVAAGKRLDAGVGYYGPAPAPADAVRVEAPLLLHYAGLDTRVAETAGPWVAALKAAHKDVTDFTYPGVNHAFNNDTSVERYDKAAAELAWGRTIAFFRKYLHA